jgi:hypothetical protein
VEDIEDGRTVDMKVALNELYPSQRKAYSATGFNASLKPSILPKRANGTKTTQRIKPIRHHKA